MTTRRISLLHKPVEHLHQQRDIVEVQAGGRLVENEQDSPAILVGEMADELEPLGFAAGEDIERLSEPQIAEADFLEDAQWLDDLVAKPGARRRLDLEGLGAEFEKNAMASVTVNRARRGSICR